MKRVYFTLRLIFFKYLIFSSLNLFNCVCKSLKTVLINESNIFLYILVWLYRSEIRSRLYYKESPVYQIQMSVKSNCFGFRNYRFLVPPSKFIEINATVLGRSLFEPVEKLVLSSLELEGPRYARTFSSNSRALADRSGRAECLRTLSRAILARNNSERNWCVIKRTDWSHRPDRSNNCSCHTSFSPIRTYYHIYHLSSLNPHSVRHQMSYNCISLVFAYSCQMRQHFARLSCLRMKLGRREVCSRHTGSSKPAPSQTKYQQSLYYLL